MGQFLFGLFAGIVVGLVMEWVIDWTGLLPKRSTSKPVTSKPAQVVAVSNKRVDDQSTTAPASSLNNADASGD